jgi:hypothetical protein
MNLLFRVFATIISIFLIYLITKILQVNFTYELNLKKNVTKNI